MERNTSLKMTSVNLENQRTDVVTGVLSTSCSVTSERNRSGFSSAVAHWSEDQQTHQAMDDDIPMWSPQIVITLSSSSQSKTSSVVAGMLQKEYERQSNSNNKREYQEEYYTWAWHGVMHLQIHAVSTWKTEAEAVTLDASDSPELYGNFLRLQCHHDRTKKHI